MRKILWPVAQSLRPFCLLTEQPLLHNIAQGAASVDVQVGFMSDPKDLPGLAHFCEHSTCSSPINAGSALLRLLPIASLSHAFSLALSRTHSVAALASPVLFLGTKQFPNEGDFERLVASGGGSNNAYTAAEETSSHAKGSNAGLVATWQRSHELFLATLL